MDIECDGLVGRNIESAEKNNRIYFMGMPFDRVPYASAVSQIAQMKGRSGFRYIVTPNVDHVVRLSHDSNLKQCYDDAWLSLCDSKPIALIARTMPLVLPRVTGSDLTVSLFNEVIAPGDKVVLIAASDEIVRRMRDTYPQITFQAYVPPRNVGSNPVELRRCIDFALWEQADFTFIAIGSPKSEQIAQALARRPGARGTCLCVGASLEFLTGIKVRAPRWMRKCGLEWVHRLGSEPRRLWRRYAFAVWPLLRMSAGEFASRRFAPVVSAATSARSFCARLLGGTHRAAR